ncbi:MAG: hypothetical protein EOO00_12945 [Chitinophagaceae bacterium]|nr:MAG: hypothetical protein EOO00_12945 [Chitinophagaceae bacterium]
MKLQTSIKVKAAILIGIFSLNTVVGFACSLGVNMSFNSRHHTSDQPVEPSVHVHKDGKKHNHPAKTGDAHDHAKQHDHANKHDHAERHEHGQQHHESGSTKHKPLDEGNCCSDEVTQISQSTKALPSQLDLIHPIFATAYLAAFYDVVLPLQSGYVSDIKQFVRSYHPPISDIRIAIQSFQV